MLPELPTPSTRNLAVRITKDAMRHVRRGHPWIYDGAITNVSHEGAPGDLAIVFDDQRDFAAVGLWDPDSPIRVRVLSTRQVTIDEAFFRTRFDAAEERRARLLSDPSITGIRLVHGENDGLPSLVIDRYADTIVVKLYSAAWYARLAPLLDAVSQQWSPTHIVIRLARNIVSSAPVGLTDGTSVADPGPPPTVEFLENGHRMGAEPIDGQKTGYFLDQRANRKLIGEYSDGARVLDVFCCHGGFSVHAAAAGARGVWSIDQSPHAVASARRNVAAAAPDVEHGALTGDAFKLMAEMGATGERFDIVVVDPPSFASRGDAVDGAIRAYARLSHLAFGLLRPGGLLFQASCSSRITDEVFHDGVEAAATRAGRALDVLERTGHDDDHPIGFSEGAYLKAVLARV